MVGPAEVALALAIANARPGATIVVPPGIHRGNFVVAADRVTLAGSPGAILDGGGKGSVLTIKGRNCTVRNLTIEGSGPDMFDTDSGVKLTGADGAVLEGLRVRRCLTGIYAGKSRDVTIRKAVLQGVPGRLMADSGDGIHLWNAPDARIQDSVVTDFRDGFYMEFAERTVLERSRATRSSRYGMHVMSTKGTFIRDNVFEHNIVGGVLMFSERCQVERNTFSHQRGPHGQGLTFKDNNDSVVRRNRLVDNTTAIFVDGSNRNRVEDNLIASNGWGVVMLASAADNRFTGNSFVNDDFEVAVNKGNRTNRFNGNYWGSAAGRKGLAAEGGYAPVRPFAMLAMQVPDLMAFGGSPAVKAIDAAFRSVPSLLGRAVVDPAPLAAPPAHWSAGNAHRTTINERIGRKG